MQLIPTVISALPLENALRDYLERNDPMVAQRLKVDPALVSAPLITTLVDATGLVIYLTIAKSILTALQA